MFNFIKSNSQIFFGFIFGMYFLFTLSNAVDINNTVSIAVLLTIIIYIQSIGTFFYFYKKNGKPRLQDWIRVGLFITLVLDFMKIVNKANGQDSITFIVNSVSLNDSSFVLIIIIFAFISLDFAWITYNTFKKNKPSNEQFIINRKDWIFIILIVSTLFQSYLLFSGVTGFGSKQSSGILSLIKMISEYLNPFALIISAYIIFIENTNNTKYKLIFYFALLIQVFTGFLSGMKENALEPILYTIIVFLIAGKRIPKNIIFIGLFALVILYPINNAYREVISNPYLNKGSSIVNMARAIKKVLTQPLDETLLGGVESYADRGSMFPFLIYVTNIEEKWTYYKNMTRYATLPINWIIPRALWEDKPRADIGGTLYILITNNKDTNTAITATSIGWAYLEGGILYIFFIFVILGLIFEFIDNKNIKKPIFLIFYIVLLHKAIKPEWDPYFMISSLIPMIILYWGLLKLIGQTRITNEN